MTTTTERVDVRRVTPAPRRAPEDTAVRSRPLKILQTLPPARYPWPEPWGSARGARPRSEFWDVATACWHSRGPRPG